MIGHACATDADVMRDRCGCCVVWYCAVLCLVDLYLFLCLASIVGRGVGARAALCDHDIFSVCKSCCIMVACLALSVFSLVPSDLQMASQQVLKSTKHRC